MKINLLKSFPLIIVIFLSGCAQFSTTQIDNSYENGKISRQITTRVSANTFWDGKSELAKFSATQNDKSQGAKVGNLSAASSGTNALALMDKFIELAKSMPK